MRSTVGPSRTSRPRSANGSMRKGWTTSSDLVRVSDGKSNNSARLSPSPAMREREGPVRRAGRVRVFYIAITLTRPSPAHRPPSPAMRERERSPQAPGEDALLHMQPVFRLVPDDRLRPVADSGGDFLAALRRRAMHEYVVGLRRSHPPL